MFLISGYSDFGFERSSNFFSPPFWRSKNILYIYGSEQTVRIWSERTTITNILTQQTTFTWIYDTNTFHYRELYLLLREPPSRDFITHTVQPYTVLFPVCC